MRRALAVTLGLLACEKSAAPPPPVDPAALKEELKRELLAELRLELAKSLAAGARPLGAAPGENPAAAVPAVEDEEGLDAPAAPPAVGEPEAPADEPAAPVRPVVAAADGPEEPFLDAPAGGGRPPPRAIDPDEPAPIRAPGKPAPVPVEDVPRPSDRDLPPAPAPFPKDGQKPAVKLLTFELAEEVDREQRIPVRPGARFKQALGKIYAYAVVKNEGPDTQVGIEWEQAGEVKSRLYLKVGHSISGWRTWSTLRMEPDAPGKWVVRVVDAHGVTVTEKPFVINK